MDKKACFLTNCKQHVLTLNALEGVQHKVDAFFSPIKLWMVSIHFSNNGVTQTWLRTVGMRWTMCKEPFKMNNEAVEWIPSFP